MHASVAASRKFSFQARGSWIPGHEVVQSKQFHLEDLERF